MPRKFSDLSAEEQVAVASYVDQSNAHERVPPREQRNEIAKNKKLVADILKSYRERHLKGFGTQQPLDFSTPEEKAAALKPRARGYMGHRKGRER